MLNDPAKDDNFLTGTQEIVVNARIADGYDSIRLSNGNWKVWKGKHTLLINCLGYDCYVQYGMLN